MAYVVMLNEGVDIMCLLAMLKFGACPAFVTQPNNNLIFTNPRIPKSAEELEALLVAIVKGIRGKPGQAPKSIVFGPTTVPTYLHSHHTFPIPKHSGQFDKQMWQQVYDARHPENRTVYLPKHIIIKPNGRGGVRMILLKPTAADRKLTAHLNRAYNQNLLSKRVVQLTSVEFTDAKDFRSVLFRYGRAAKISWADASSAYSHRNLNALMGMRMGFQIPGTNLHGRYESFTFGSGQSCLEYVPLRVCRLMCLHLSCCI